MSITEHELESELQDVTDPLNDEDIVSLGLINEITIDDDRARISLAFNTPYSPVEMDIGSEIKAIVSEHGLEPDLRADVSEGMGFDEEVLPRVRNVIAVSSAKGGVGKTTIAANIAAGLNDLGGKVGLLDADIHGPNVPRILPVDADPGLTPDETLIPPNSNGVRIMSMGMLLEDDDDPAILRGPMVNKFMMQFVEGVEWGYLDYLIVDLPPGTGDASLNLLQSLPVRGVVIVSTPQDMALDDTRKGIQMFRKHNTPVIGVVENMSTFICPSCEDEHQLFGTDGVNSIIDDYDVPLLQQVPLHPDFGADGSGGAVVSNEDSEVEPVMTDLVERVADRIGEINRRSVAEHVTDDDSSVSPEVDG